MLAKMCGILIILSCIVISYGTANYSFQPDNILNSTESNNIQVNSSAISNESIQAAMLKLPLSFIENRGQVSDETKFMIKTSQTTVYFTPSEILFALALKNNTSIVRMSFEGAEPRQLVGKEPLPGKANFFIGNNSSNWVTDIPTYNSLSYENLYPGIDLVFNGTEGNLKSEFVVSPGADPGKIIFVYANQDNLSLDYSGSLIINTSTGKLTDCEPFVYQLIDGKKISVDGKYRLISPARVGFELGQYNHSYPLVIDPVLKYSTYLGGNSNLGEVGYGIAVDSSGNAYVTGITTSSNFPVVNAYDYSLGGYDAFVTKINPAGNALVYSTFLGGMSMDFGTGIAVDSNGNAYVTGATGSSDFPVVNAYCKTHQASFDAFVTKFNAAGDGLVYSTYLGGTFYNYGTGIAVDSNGNAYVTGFTQSQDFPLANAYDNSLGGNYDAFVTKFNADGDALAYSTYLGGSTNDWGYGIAVDSSGNAYVTGWTDSSDFPTANAYDKSFKGDRDAFVTKFNADGDALSYSTYLGGVSYDEGYGIAVDSSGNAYVTGYTQSPDFPIVQAYDNSYNGYQDVFVTKINPTGDALVYSTYLGGSTNDFGTGIAVDSSGNAYVTGHTDSSDFPMVNAPDNSYNGNIDVFVTKLNPAGGALFYSTYLGGGSDDEGYGIAVDSDGNAYMTGYTYSWDFPVVNAYDSSYNGYQDVFVTVLIVPQNQQPLPPANLRVLGIRDCSEAELSWNANSETNIAGYKVYYGTASKTYGASVDAGDVTNYILSLSPGQTYYIAITAYNTAGESDYSNEVSLDMPIRPAISTQPSSKEVCLGSSVSFSVVATGDDLSYQWMHGSSTIGGATGPTLQINSVTADDAGDYTVSVTNCAGSVTSSAATLIVNSAPSISTQPASQALCLGSKATFTVAASGDGLSYQWMKGASPISGATSASYSIDSVTAADADDYTVVVTGTCGSVTSNKAALTLNAATATTDPSAQAACLGGPATFSVIASGAGSFSYQWKKDGTPLVDAVDHISGTTTNTLAINPVAEGDVGIYSVDVKGGCGDAVPSKGATLTLKAAATTTDPAPQAVCLGGSAIFSVTTTGADPITYQWKKNGAALQDVAGHISGSSTSTLTINPVASDDAGSYSVVVAGACGSSTSKDAALTLKATTTTTDPAPQEVCLGGTASFSITATGAGPITYQWKKEGTKLDESSNHISGAATNTLTINNILAGDAGSYSVDVTGNCGTVTSKGATLTVNSHVQITVQPVSQTLCLGKPASFTVAATGTGLSYQWKHGSSTIQGATGPTLQINSVKADDAGTYTAAVSNSCGSVTSSEATLTVKSARPPDCSKAVPSTATIWPPNHKFVDIHVNGVTDPEGDPVTITIDKIYQDEPIQYIGSGNFEPDGKGIGTSTASVRAERSGTGNGRVYHIYFTASDGRGGICHGEIHVSVPHDQNKPAVDDGTLYDSTKKPVSPNSLAAKNSNVSDNRPSMVNARNVTDNRLRRA